MKEYLVRPIDGAPDGRAWEMAERLTDFSFPWLEREAPETLFRALHSKERFHFRFEVVDEDLVLDEKAEGAERVLGSDRVELFFACDADLTRYHCAEMDPRGIVYEYLARHYREFDTGWRWPGLEVEGRLREGGYEVEGSIALAVFKELGIEGAAEGWLRAGAYRAEFSHGEEGEVVQDWISWVDPATPEADFHVPASFGLFRLV